MIAQIHRQRQFIPGPQETLDIAGPHAVIRGDRADFPSVQGNHDRGTHATHAQQHACLIIQSGGAPETARTTNADRITIFRVQDDGTIPGTMQTNDVRA